MPGPDDDEQFAALKEEVARLFRTHEMMGKVRILYITTVFLGSIPR